MAVWMKSRTTSLKVCGGDIVGDTRLGDEWGRIVHRLITALDRL